MTRLDAWLIGFEPAAPQDLKLGARVSPEVTAAFRESYVGLNAAEIDRAVVVLTTALAGQISKLHQKFDLQRPLTKDLLSADLATMRQVA